jgi:hypothetical protein
MKIGDPNWGWNEPRPKNPKPSGPPKPLVELNGTLAAKLRDAQSRMQNLSPDERVALHSELTNYANSYSLLDHPEVQLALRTQGGWNYQAME